jgi:hypothetical protein
MTMPQQVFADEFAGVQIMQKRLPDGSLMTVLNDIAISNNKWINLRAELVVDLSIPLDPGTDRTQVTALAIAYPTSFSLLKPDGIIAVDTAVAIPVYLPDGTLVVRLTASITAEQGNLMRVGYQVIVFSP